MSCAVNSSHNSHVNPVLKENVISPLIPAGTAMEYYRNIQLCPGLEEPAVRIQKEGQEAYELEVMRMNGETGNRRRLGLGVQR